MSIRPATGNDAAGIAEVHVAAWRAAYALIVPEAVLVGLDVERRAARWRGILADLDQGSRVFVALWEGRVCGFAGIGRDRGGLDVGELTALYVDPALWGRGIGRGLLAAAEASLAAEGFSEAVLWVLAGNQRGRAVYGRFGWTADGTETDLDFDGVPVPEVRYRKVLGKPGTL